MLVLVLSSLMAVIQELHGSQLLFTRDLADHLRRAKDEERTAPPGSAEESRTRTNVNFSVGVAPVLVHNERQLAIARYTGALFLLSGVVAAAGIFMLWQLRRKGLWLFCFGSIGYAAAHWWYGGSADIGEVVSSSITLGIALVLSAMLALQWRVLR